MITGGRFLLLADVVVVIEDLFAVIVVPTNTCNPKRRQGKAGDKRAGGVVVRKRAGYHRSRRSLPQICADQPVLCTPDRSPHRTRPGRLHRAFRENNTSVNQC
jgi:hypothetical protein